MTRCLVLIAALALVPIEAAGQKITRETLTTGGETRSYYLFVPERAADSPAPLVVMLHGSNRDGKILLDHWQNLARKEGIILAGPDSRQKIEWNMTPDNPRLFYDIVEAIKGGHNVDPRRVYLFGHSAGAIHSLHLAILESEYFAAAAVHAGVFMDDFVPFLDHAKRKIPLAIWVGTNDRFFPLPAVRASRDLLSGRQFPVDLTEINGHTHDYYGRPGEINKAAWAFLQKHVLPGPPKYQEYEIGK